MTGGPPTGIIRWSELSAGPLFRACPLAASLRSACTKKAAFRGNAAVIIAEREGFEPPEPFSSTVFKTAVIDHSTTSPVIPTTNQTLSEHAVPKLECKGNIIFSNSKNTLRYRAESDPKTELKHTRFPQIRLEFQYHLLNLSQRKLPQRNCHSVNEQIEISGIIRKVSFRRNRQISSYTGHVGSPLQKGRAVIYV